MQKEDDDGEVFASFHISQNQLYILNQYQRHKAPITISF